jgi:hypothetical protein
VVAANLGLVARTLKSVDVTGGIVALLAGLDALAAQREIAVVLVVAVGV